MRLHQFSQVPGSTDFRSTMDDLLDIPLSLLQLMTDLYDVNKSSYVLSEAMVMRFECVDAIRGNVSVWKLK